MQGGGMDATGRVAGDRLPGPGRAGGGSMTYLPRSPQPEPNHKRGYWFGAEDVQLLP
jgi:hypothetical protein